MIEKEMDGIEDLLTAIYIQNSRIYDVLVRLLMTENQEDALAMVEAHSRGELYGPPPSLIGEESESV